jgi:hypothetical protein
MNTLSQVSRISTKGCPLLPSDPGEPNHDEHGRLHPFSDVEYLASLRSPVLKELSKNVAQALAAAKQARKKPVKSGEESILQVHGKRAAQSSASKSSTDTLRCEYLGCTITFRRNKDRRRHFRYKHKPSTRTFICPVVDCPSGSGHKYLRSEKLRDHLRAQKLALIDWSCVLPGCSETSRGRAGLIDHLGQHDYNTRVSNEKLLAEYGFASYMFGGGYLLATFICSVPGCPFGTSNKDAINAHLSIHHDGPFCPCPIPSCQRVSQDYGSAFTHLAREHDYDTRQRFQKEINSQNLRAWNFMFICPICHNEIKRATPYSAALHCRKHDHQELLRVSEALMKAWTYSFGSIIHGPEQLTITGDIILPYIILPKKEIKKLCTKADFEQAVARIRAAIELSKNAQLS